MTIIMCSWWSISKSICKTKCCKHCCQCCNHVWKASFWHGVKNGEKLSQIFFRSLHLKKLSRNPGSRFQDYKMDKYTDDLSGLTNHLSCLPFIKAIEKACISLLGCWLCNDLTSFPCILRRHPRQPFYGWKQWDDCLKGNWEVKLWPGPFP